MSVVSNNILAGASGQGGGGYEISRSLRFNAGDSSFLNRTPSSAGNRKTWTMSYWIKRAKLGDEQMIFSAAESSSNRVHFYYPNSDLIAVYSHAFYYTLHEARDPGAWMHLVFACDTTQSTATDRFKIYKNGVLIDSFLNQSHPAQNLDTTVNGAFNHQFSGRGYTSADYADAYLADVHFIDGQALAATDFGESDDNGVWQPKKFAGTYGTNGFHLDFKDNSSNAALGTDTSGNSNTWTVNNLTATTGTAKQGFDVVTYTGTGSSQSISGLAFQPDFVWIKNRSSALNHHILDSVRGAQNVICSNTTDAQFSSSGSLTSFNANGFTVGSNSNVNGNGNSIVGWCWKAGGAASSNTDGSITSLVSANNSYGFSIAKYTGTGANATFGHGLTGQTPKFIIVKKLTAASWNVYHSEIGATKTLELNSTGSQATTQSWGDTAPTSSVVTVGNYPDTNDSGGNYIAYCWSEVAGFSKFGSWNGNSGSTTVTFGFRPRFLLWKSTSAASWHMIDSARGVDQNIYPNDAVAESNQDYYAVDFTDTGITINSSYADVNASGSTYVYMAFAEQPDGSTIDSLVDTPTNVAEPTDTGAGGEVVGNYATLNPLHQLATATLANGNLQTTSSNPAFSTFLLKSGKWYCEHTVTATGYNLCFSQIDHPSGATPSDSNSKSIGWYTNGTIYYGAGSTSGASSYAIGDVLGAAIDMDNSTIKLYKNGTLTITIDFSTGTYHRFTDGMYISQFNGTGHFNFGQRPFSNSNVPSGYKALCTANLPEPTIADGSKYFDTKLYTGNGGTQTVSGLEFSPSFVWFKNRASSVNHHLLDVVRGAGNGTNVLYSNLNNAEGATDSLTAFTSDGFTVGSNDSVNKNNNAIAAWAWDAGTSTVTNNDGSIASQVRANPSAGFSIVSYTNGDETVGHGLSAPPELILTKRLDAAYTWGVYSKPTTKDKYLVLNSSAAAGSYSNIFGSAEPTSSVFGTSTAIAPNNSSMIAYCFAPVEGYSAMGSYTGNGSSDGVFIYTGFTPSWLLFKRHDAGSDWTIYDTTRDPHNVAGDKLEPNTSDAESAEGAVVDILSNGFKFRRGSLENGGNDQYIYMAFASHPFKTSRAR